MKAIFYVLLLGVVSCSKPVLVKNNDLEKENLKGKVKSTYIEERFIKKKHGIYLFHGKIVNKVVNCFNERGMRTYSCSSAPGDKTECRFEYEFDEQNRVKKQTEYMSDFSPIEMDFYYSNKCTSAILKIDGELVGKTIQLFDKNLLVRTNHFNLDTKSRKYQLGSYTTFSYYNNNQDSIITYLKFSKKRNTYIKYMQDKYWYDSKDSHLSKHENYYLWYHHEDPANIEKRDRSYYIYKDYQYKYDRQGNWIEKIVQENGVLKGYKRKINYYV